MVGEWQMLKCLGKYGQWAMSGIQYGVRSRGTWLEDAFLHPHGGSDHVDIV